MENKKDLKYLSLIIPTKDRKEDLKRVIKNLSQQHDNFFELIIVDASSQSKKKLIRNWLEKFNCSFDFQYIKTKANLSYQRNIGVEHAIGEIIGFLDDDTWFDRDFIINLRRLTESHPEVDGFSGPNKIKGSSFVRNFFSKFFLISGYGFLNNQRVSFSGTSRMIANCSRVIKAQYLPGCFSFYRKKVFDECFFDELLAHPPCFDDLDFGYRSSRKFNYIFSPLISFYHNSTPIGRVNVAQREYRTGFYYIYLIRSRFNQLWRLPFVIWTLIGYSILNIAISIKEFDFNIIINHYRGLIDGMKLKSDNFILK